MNAEQTREQKKKKERRFYVSLVVLAASLFAICIVLEVTVVAIGISYAVVDDEETSLIIQGAATGGVIIVSCVFVVTFHYVTRWLNKIHHIEETSVELSKRSLKPRGTAIEMKTVHVRYRQYTRTVLDQGDDHDNTRDSRLNDDELDAPYLVMGSPNDTTDGDPIHALDYIGKDIMKPLLTEKLKEMSPRLLVILFLSSLSFLMGLMALVWGITLAYNFGFEDENVIWPFITVEAIVGLACPLLIYIGIILFAIIMDYITFGKVDARKAVHTLLPSVQLLKSRDNEYWVIKNTFYFLIRERPSDIITSSCTKLADFSRATVYFIIIIGLSFGLSTSYFMNRTIVEQVNTRECKSDLHYDCFVIEDDTWIYVDCNDNETLSRHSFIHCYTFLRFGIDNNPISTLAEAFAFHLATVGFFGQIFGIVKILLRLRPSRLWGIWLFLIGLIVIGIGLFLIFFRGSFSLHRDVIGCFQIVMVGFYLVTIGILVFEAGLWEREKVKSIAGAHGSIELQHLYKPGHHHKRDRAVSGNTNEEHTTTV